jgi:chromosome segregation ATPase
LFAGIKNDPERVSKTLAEYEADVAGLQRKNEELLGSVKQHGEKHEALAKEKETLDKQIRELDAKLKASLPDKERQAFEAEIENTKPMRHGLGANFIAMRIFA